MGTRDSWDGWLLRAGAEAMQGLLATGGGESLSWNDGALGRPLRRVGQSITKRKRLSVFRYGGMNMTVTQEL